MPWWVWIGIGVFVAALLVASAVMALSLRRLARASHSFQARLTPSLESLTAATERLSRKNEVLGRDQKAASAAITRLRGSIRQVQVLVAALHEIRFVLRLVRLVRAVR